MRSQSVIISEAQLSQVMLEVQTSWVKDLLKTWDGDWMSFLQIGTPTANEQVLFEMDECLQRESPTWLLLLEDRTAEEPRI